jgi:hypothetical protein
MLREGHFRVPLPHPCGEVVVKIKNKANGVVAEVPDSLGELLVKAGSWEADAVPAEEKPVRRRAKKPAAVEESVSDEE